MFSDSLDFLVENDTVIVEGSGCPQDLFVTLFEDRVAQELNETFTINLEPTFSDLESLPRGEAVFFVRSITITIVDNDCELIFLFLAVSIIVWKFYLFICDRCGDSII